MELRCNQASDDSLEVEDALDKDGELQIGIYNMEDYTHVFLSKSDAKAMAEHILQLLEESK